MSRNKNGSSFSGTTPTGDLGRDAVSLGKLEITEKAALSGFDYANEQKSAITMHTYIIPGRVTQEVPASDLPVKYMKLPVDIHMVHPVKNGIIVLVVNQIYGVSKLLEFEFKKGGYGVFKNKCKKINIEQQMHTTNGFHEMIDGTIIWIKGTNLYDLHRMNLTAIGLIQTPDALAAAHRYAEHFGMIFCGTQ